MDKAALVGLDIAAGSDAVRILEASGIPLKLALWISTPEFEEGRLALASPALDQSDTLRSYDQVAVALHGKMPQAPPILILRMKDPVVVHLRQLFAKTKSTEGMRLGGQLIGNRFVNEAYVYKIK